MNCRRIPTQVNHIYLFVTYVRVEELLFEAQKRNSCLLLLVIQSHILCSVDERC
jgi:hypothetical protein